MKKLLLLAILATGTALQVYAQNSVGIGTTTPDPNAVLDLQSPTNDQGLLIPRLDTTSILAMPMNASHDGMLVYADEMNAFVYWDGDSLDWYLLNENFNGGGGNDDDWYFNGDTLINNSSYVVVGNSAANPDAKMIIASNGEGIVTALSAYSDGDGSISIGIQGSGVGSSTNIGVYGYGQSSAAGDTVAGTVGEAEVGAGGVGFGVLGKIENGTSLGYAIFGDAQGAGAGTMVGVYGSAENGTNNYAGYFGPGNVYVENDLGIGTGIPTNKLHVFGGSITIDDGANPYTLPISDGAGGDVLTTDGAGNVGWQPAAVGGLVDSDGDTEIDVEQSADEDIIHFYLGNSTGYAAQEYYRMTGPRLEVMNSGNSVFIGQGAGQNDDLIANNNVMVGYFAGNSNISGNNIAALGHYAARLNTTGTNNTAIGNSALYANSTSSYNTAIGRGAAYNSLGGYNTVLGGNALYSNRAGNNATAIGYRAMYYANNTATSFSNYNTAVGYESLRGSTTAANNTGNSNSAFGTWSLQNNTTGSSNTAIGFQSLQNNSSGGANTALGQGAMRLNTTGSLNATVGSSSLQSNTTGQRNSSLGYASMGQNQGGSFNTATGAYALQLNVSGNNNAAVGYAALIQTTSSNNVGLGYYAGDNNTTGSNNVFIGYNSDASTTNLTNATALGYNAVVTASNRVQLGSNADVDFDGALMPNSLAGSAGDVLISQGAGIAPIWGAATSSNIYNVNGSLTGARTVTMGANTLSFTSSAVNGFSVDGSTFSVNAANNRVGILTTAPGYPLEVNGTVKSVGLNGPTNGYLGVQGALNFDAITGLTNAGDEIGVLGVSTGGSATDNYGVFGYSNFWGGKFQHSVNGNEVKLAGTAGAIQIQDGTQAAGRVLTSDATGVGTWQTVSAGPSDAFQAYAGAEVINGSQKINFSAELFDDGNNYDLTTDEYVVPTTGYYFFHGSVTWDDATSAGRYQMKITRNGTVVNLNEFEHTEHNGLTHFNTQITSVLNLTAGDRIQLTVYEGYTSGTVNTAGGFTGQEIYFTGYKLY